MAFVLSFSNKNTYFFSIISFKAGLRETSDETLACQRGSRAALAIMVDRQSVTGAMSCPRSSVKTIPSDEWHETQLPDPAKRDDSSVVKSRVHFRRGFDETGYAKTILVVAAPGPWVGTLRLDALDYQHAPIDRLYPFGEPGDVPE